MSGGWAGTKAGRERGGSGGMGRGGFGDGGGGEARRSEVRWVYHGYVAAYIIHRDPLQNNRT